MASDSDGSHLVTVDKGGYIYVSGNSGASWTAVDSQREWFTVASDADGSHLAAVTYATGSADYIYLSSDSGANWTAQTQSPAGDRNWHAIGIDADGSHLAAGVYSGYIYTSSDSGTTWVERTGPGSRIWESIASSSNGAVLIAVASGSAGRVFTSYDAGATWTERCPTGTCENKEWVTAASDSDGSHLIAGMRAGRLYVSRDYGLNWSEEFPMGNVDSDWLGGASSADGSFLVVANNSANVYTGAQSSTLVDLAGFGARYTGRTIRLAWRTASETDNAGFHLWRSGAADGAYERITGQMIPAVGSVTQGAAYAFPDPVSVPPGATFFYKLEDIDTADVSTFHGPIQADMSTVSLLAPTGAVAARRPARFTWKSARFPRFSVQFSGSADFTGPVIALGRSTRSVSVRGALRSKFGFTPTLRQWRSIKRLAGADGTLYWRIAGKRSTRAAAPSSPGVLRIQ